ncbi:MAG: hypothetical protein ACLP1X_27970 [Polyangiaceae bacterium]
MAPILLATLVSFATWAATPMETGLAACALVWSAFAALSVTDTRSAAVMGLAAAISALVRPEALALLPIFIALSSMNVPRANRVRIALVATSAAVLPLVALFAFRLSYFGVFLPNTYVAKVGGLSLAVRLRTGLLYVGKFVFVQPLVAACALVALRRAEAREVSILALGFLGAVLWTGGDHFPYERLAVPALPLLCALTAAVVEKVGARQRTALALGLLLQVGWAVRSTRQFGGVIIQRDFVKNCVMIGESLGRLPGGTFATISIGAIGYLAAERPILDMVGLADAHIARSPRLLGAKQGHDHGDADYVLRRAPELVMLYSWAYDHPITDAEERSLLALYHEAYAAPEQLLLDTRFRQRYEPFDFVLNNGMHLRLWHRLDVSLAKG